MTTKRRAPAFIQTDAIAALNEAKRDLRERLESLKREVTANLDRLKTDRPIEPGWSALALMADLDATRVKERERALNLVVELRESTGC